MDNTGIYYRSEVKKAYENASELREGRKWVIRSHFGIWGILLSDESMTMSEAWKSAYNRLKSEGKL